MYCDITSARITFEKGLLLCKNQSQYQKWRLLSNSNSDINKAMLVVSVATWVALHLFRYINSYLFKWATLKDNLRDYSLKCDRKSKGNKTYLWKIKTEV